MKHSTTGLPGSSIETKPFKPIYQAIIVGLSSMAFISASAFAETSFGDKHFMKTADKSGHYEIEGSKLAQAKASNAEVKALAKHIIDDHTKAAAELKTLASKKGVKLPGEPGLVHKASLKLLNTHEGADFDESYINNVGVDAHQEAIEDFSEAAQDADDPEVKAFAKKTLPALQKHLDMAKALQNKLVKK